MGWPEDDGPRDRRVLVACHHVHNLLEFNHSDQRKQTVESQFFHISIDIVIKRRIIVLSILNNTQIGLVDLHFITPASSQVL